MSHIAQYTHKNSPTITCRATLKGYFRFMLSTFNYFVNITYSALYKCDCMIGNKIVTKCRFFMAKLPFFTPQI